MPEFANPFVGMVPRKMDDRELARAIMLNIAAEYEAVHLYLAHMDATDNGDAKKVLYDVALEELVHAGEFTSLLHRIDPVAAARAREGFEEVRELLGSKAPQECANGESGEAQEGASGPEKGYGERDAQEGKLTIGSLRGRD